MGGFEPTARPWGIEGIPETFEFTELAEDWDQFEIFMMNAIQRCPAMEDAGIMQQLLNLGFFIDGYLC